MSKPLFGPGGNSDSFHLTKLATVKAPFWVKDFGLDAYEYEAGRGVPKSLDSFTVLGNNAREAGIKLSIHAPYFISLSSVESEKRANSVEYIKRSAHVSALLGAEIMVVHCGSCAKISRETAMGYAKETLEATALMLEENRFPSRLGIETMGKINQLGTLSEVLELCKISPKFAPVVDFGHLNARDRGSLNTVDDFKRIFDEIATALGGEYADNLHCHFSKIMYTEMGEKKHLTFEDEVYGPRFEPLAKAMVDLGVSPTIICESAGTQSDDALFMKMTYERELKK
jgi:deoxyribonuclease-4